MDGPKTKYKVEHLYCNNLKEATFMFDKRVGTYRVYRLNKQDEYVLWACIVINNGTMTVVPYFKKGKKQPKDSDRNHGEQSARSEGEG